MYTLQVKDFDLQHIFDCGQAFRWEKIKDYDYIGISGNQVIRVVQEGSQLTLSCSAEAFETYWRRYFDLDRDYGLIKSKLLALDPSLEEAIEFGRGIRLLNQEPFEMLITFILSANNHIPRIRSLVKRLSETYGSPIDHPWVDLIGPLYTFPSPKELANSSVEDLRKLGLGYRDKYVYETAQKVASEVNTLKDTQSLPYEEAKKMLRQFSGVGPKVADCILLFSAGRHEAFPIDTWIKKTLERRYGLEGLSGKSLEAWIDNTFGTYKGYAQQYLFFFERENHF